MSFVELSDNKGWIVESAADGTMLDRAADGKPVVEHITGESSLSLSLSHRHKHELLTTHYFTITLKQ